MRHTRTSRPHAFRPVKEDVGDADLKKGFKKRRNGCEREEGKAADARGRGKERTARRHRAGTGRRRPEDTRGEDLARIGKFIVRDEDINRIKLELITFFKDNPGTVDSAERIGMRLGRPKEEVERSLEELSEHGICYKVPSRPMPIYMYYATALILRRLAEVAPELDYNAQLELVEKLLARRSNASK